MPLTIRAVLLPAVLALAGCASEPGSKPSSGSEAFEYPPAPAVAPGRPGVDAAARTAARALVRGAARDGSVAGDALERLAGSGDARQAWLLADVLRFVRRLGDERTLVAAFERLAGVDPRADPTFEESAWRSVTNHLIAWDLPAAPGYVKLKAELFTAVEPGWRPFFADPDAEIDWRLVSWGGVLIDDRPEGADEPCERGCIPALDDPKLTGAAGGDWYPEDRIVFAVTVGGETVAFPRNIMEVHEMVNITIGGRRLGIPYCTLCGSAQAYFTDSVPAGLERPVLRTSGLLTRSNKVTYDLRSRSVLDTFTGRALSGPLHDRRVTLEQASVTVGTWGELKRARPGVRIVARDGGLGRDYPLDPLRGRDDDGPIFPIGPVDPRLPVQERVVGVIAPGGRPVAFPSGAA
ncbi:MAG: DUF3179 domain-containing (seleno)protein, partial [Thermoleophilaceae bacterium]